MKKCFTAFSVVLAIAGCGHTSHPASVPGPVPTPGLPLESARTPDGATPARPPVSLATKVSSLHISSKGLHLIEGFEGYSRCAYWDPYGHVWTAGYGQTRGIHSGFCFTSQAAAAANLRNSVETEYQWAIRDIGVAFNQNEVDALDSFAYNLGAGIFTGTLSYDLRHRAFYAASRIMLDYDHAKGVILAGLVTRRQEEVRLFLTPVASCNKQCRLGRAYKRRAALRSNLTRHHCRTIHGKKAYPLCPRWGKEGRVVNREIRKLGGH